MTIPELLSTVLIVLGSLVFATAALGIVRFPDPYTRISAVGTAAGLGILLVVFGAFLRQPSVTTFLLVLLIIVLQLATAAIGSMAIARSAYLSGVPLRRRSYDELATAGRDAAEEEGASRE